MLCSELYQALTHRSRFAWMYIPFNSSLQKFYVNEHADCRSHLGFMFGWNRY